MKTRTQYWIACWTACLTLGTLSSAEAQEAEHPKPHGPEEVESIFDTLNQTVDNSAFQALQKGVEIKLERSADLGENVKRFRELSNAERSLNKLSLPQVKRDTKVAQGNLKSLNRGLSVVNFFGPFATGLGTLSATGSLTEATIGGVNDFGKFWVQETGTAVGGILGAPGGPVVAAGAGFAGSAKAGELYDKSAGKLAEDAQQMQADLRALAKYGPLDPDKLARLSSLIGAEQRRTAAEIAKINSGGFVDTVGLELVRRRDPEIAALTTGKEPQSTMAGSTPQTIPIPAKPESNPFGTKPSDWPAKEPWPPSTERLIELMNAQKATVGSLVTMGGKSDPPAPPSPGGSAADFAASGNGGNPPESAPPPGGSAADFADPNAGGSPSGNITNPAKQMGKDALKNVSFDASGFARGQQRADNEAAARVEGDYTEARRLESELRAAEEEFRRATLEAQRVAEQERAAEEAAQQAAENARAQRRAYEAYQRYIAQVQAYNQWIERQRQLQQHGTSQPVGGGGGHHQSGGMIQDPPR